jgi:ribose 5-phosphate isomerase A
MANVESGKKAAAIAAIDCHVLPLLTERTPEPLFFQPAETERSQSRVVLGIGSGSTVVYAVRHLAAKLQGTAEPNSPRSDGSGRSDSWRPFVCVPTSFQAKQLILSHRLPLGTLEEFPVVDVTVDGADEVDLDLNCVKGNFSSVSSLNFCSHCCSLIFSSFLQSLLLFDLLLLNLSTFLDVGFVGGGGCQVLEKLVAFNSRQLIIIADDRKQSDLLFTKVCWTSTFVY